MSPTYFSGKCMAAGAGPNNQKQIPELLRCDRCGQPKRQNAFSKNRVDYARDIGSPEALRKLVCLECTGAPATELQCNGPCNRTKGLDKFSRVQRTTPDIAICKVCMWDREQVQPGNMRDFKNKDDEEDEEDGVAATTSGGTSLNFTISTASLNGSSSITRGLRKRMEDDEYEIVSHSNLATSRAPASTTGRASGTLHSSSGVAGSTSGVPGNSNSQVTNRAGGWTKIKTVQHQLVPRPEDSDDEIEVADEDSDDAWEM